MGDKIEGYRAKVKGYPEDHVLRPVGIAIGHALQTKHRPADKYAMADCVAHLRQMKDLIASAAKAVQEQLDIRANDLYDFMLEHEEDMFARQGLKFYQTSESWVKARDELGGRANPDLKSWLNDNELGDIVRQDINYQTLQGTVNEWLTNNPIEVVRGGDTLEGDALYDALGVDAESFAWRKQQHERIHELCDIGGAAKLGIKKD